VGGENQSAITLPQRFGELSDVCCLRSAARASHVQPPALFPRAKTAEKTFKFQVKPDEDVDPKDKFDADILVFGQANLVTESGKSGIVGMEVFLDGRLLFPVTGHYDPLGFPADNFLSKIDTVKFTVRDLTRAHEVTVRALKGTEFTKRTVFDIQLKILDVN